MNETSVSIDVEELRPLAVVVTTYGMACAPRRVGRVVTIEIDGPELAPPVSTGSAAPARTQRYALRY